MGNTLGGELPSSWDDDDVIKWKKNATAMQQSIYLQFEGSQFHDMEDLSRELRISKICFAIYGAPSESVDNLEDAYSTEQRAFAEKIYEKIHETYMKAPEEHLRLGFIFVFCKEGEKEYQVSM
ncbi:hypothetical protein GCK32_021654 [Trichostrongylus colubriformis]|uniref:Uncharacterized protein n=1 Tax=Trichostrongylus colubriformis TaxID=6319 RepID=A0AAN8FI99_TRICO